MPRASSVLAFFSVLICPTVPQLKKQPVQVNTALLSSIAVTAAGGFIYTSAMLAAGNDASLAGSDIRAAGFGRHHEAELLIYGTDPKNMRTVYSEYQNVFTNAVCRTQK